MNDSYVLFWWQRGEFAEQIGDWQATSCWEQPGADLLTDDAGLVSMQAAPLGEPTVDFDVRCVFDSRIVNSYDFNFSTAIALIGTSAGGNGSWSAIFTAPTGYRAVPRKWQVFFDDAPTGAASNSVASVSQGLAALPNNQNIIIGAGTGDNPIETFFICDELTQFGMFGINGNIGLLNTTGVVTCYGNLVPVTNVPLPLSVSNQQRISSQQGAP